MTVGPAANFLLEQKVRRRLFKAIEKQAPTLAFFEDLLCCTLVENRTTRNKQADVWREMPYCAKEAWKQKVHDKLTTWLYALPEKKMLLLWEALEADNLLYALKVIAEGRRQYRKAKTARSNMEDITLG